MYNVKYIIDYPNINNQNTQIFIKQVNYTDQPILIDKLGYSPLSLKYYGEGKEKFQPIKTSEARINLLSEVDFEWFEFASFEEKQYLIEITFDQVPFWSGWLVADNYSENYTFPPYEVTIVANDYLTTLKDIPFLEEGNFIYESKSALEIILLILSKLELTLETWDATDVFPISGNTNFGALSQVYIDCKKYINNIREENEESFNCFEVLEDILLTYGLTLSQNKNRWEIKHFDSFVKRYYKYNSVGTFIELEEVDLIRNLDSIDLFLLEGSGNIEVEGSYKTVILNHDLGRKNISVRGGDFYPDSWTGISVMVNQHKYFNFVSGGGLFFPNGNRAVFSKQNDNIVYPTLPNNTTIINAAKDSYIYFDVPFSKLPIPDKTIDYHLDFNFFSQLIAQYDLPPLYDDPSFDRVIFENFLEQQLNQLFGNLVFNHLWKLEIHNSTTNTVWYLSFNPRFDNGGNDEIVDDRYNWTTTDTNDWEEFTGEELEVTGNIDPLLNKKKYRPNRRSGNAITWTDPTYEFKQRIQLYELTSNTNKLINRNDEGFIRVYISSPYFFQVNNYHSGVPTDYRVNFQRVNSYIRLMDFTNDNFNISNQETFIGDADKNIRNLATIDVRLGDGNSVSQNSLFNLSGNTFSNFIRGTEEGSLLQFTANRIISQYENPSVRFRGRLFTKGEKIDLSQLIYIEDIDKFFVIHGFTYEDIGNFYEVELIELAGFSGFGNRQLSWIKDMAVTIVNNQEGYSIEIIEEEI